MVIPGDTHAKRPCPPPRAPSHPDEPAPPRHPPPGRTCAPSLESNLGVTGGYEGVLWGGVVDSPTCIRIPPTPTLPPPAPHAPMEPGRKPSPGPLTFVCGPGSWGGQPGPASQGLPPAARGGARPGAQDTVFHTHPPPSFLSLTPGDTQAPDGQAWGCSCYVGRKPLPAGASSA